MRVLQSTLFLAGFWLEAFSVL